MSRPLKQRHEVRQEIRDTINETAGGIESDRAPALTRPVPDQYRVPENLPDTMKRDHLHFPRFVFQLEREPVAFLEIDFSEGDADDLVCGMVHVPDFKRGRSKVFVPADFV